MKDSALFAPMKRSLAQLQPGEKGKISDVEKGELHAKITELGLFSGKQVEVLFRAPFGDPIAVNIEGYVLSLRKEEAELVEVEA
jgi:Fe2+ transport system protein FeoA